MNTKVKNYPNPYMQPGYVAGSGKGYKNPIPTLKYFLDSLNHHDEESIQETITKIINLKSEYKGLNELDSQVLQEDERIDEYINSWIEDKQDEQIIIEEQIDIYKKILKKVII